MSKQSRRIKWITDNRTYRILTSINKDPYLYDGWSIYHSGPRKWKKKEIFIYQYRSYLNWKHNRRTQYKNTET